MNQTDRKVALVTGASRGIGSAIASPSSAARHDGRGDSNQRARGSQYFGPFV
jgi:NAD(P)-dependent dehydrogenase (short-subunit alcohol dehydrogenase family)